MPYTYTMRAGVSFTRESVERALSIHRDAGLIKGWYPIADSKGTRNSPLYRVEVSNGDWLDIATIWEAHAFVNGIATTRQAFAKKGMTV